MPGKAEIWIDLDNTPHVPFFKPVIRELGKRDIGVVTTARDAYQVCDLAARMQVHCTPIGRHYGRNKVAKLLGTFYRAVQLGPVVRRARPQLAVSHGSRSQLVLSKFMRIPTVETTDYEHATNLPIFRPSWLIVPEVIRETGSFPRERVLRYPGVKEDVYLPDFVPNPALLKDLGVELERHILVTVRPPATEAHYHRPESEPLFFESMRRLCAEPNVLVVVLPRSAKQMEWCRKELPDCFASGRVIVPDHAIDGLNLIWHSDLVISGGGTMNREAASLGVPVYSIFRGTIGAVDRYLAEHGRLVLIESIEDVHTKIVIRRRPKDWAPQGRSHDTLQVLVSQLVDILEKARGEA